MSSTDLSKKKYKKVLGKNKFEIESEEGFIPRGSLTIHMRSGRMVGKKPAREVKTSVRVDGHESRIDRLKERGKRTVVRHRAWERQATGESKLVHNHIKAPVEKGTI